MVLGSIGRGYCEKKQSFRIFGQAFWLGYLSAFDNEEMRNNNNEK